MNSVQQRGPVSPQELYTEVSTRKSLITLRRKMEPDDQGVIQGLLREGLESMTDTEAAGSVSISNAMGISLLSPFVSRKILGIRCRNSTRSIDDMIRDFNQLTGQYRVSMNKANPAMEIPLGKLCIFGPSEKREIKGDKRIFIATEVPACQPYDALMKERSAYIGELLPKGYVGAKHVRAKYRGDHTVHVTVGISNDWNSARQVVTELNELELLENLSVRLQGASKNRSRQKPAQG